MTTILPFLQTLPDDPVFYSGQIVRGRTFAALAEHVNSFAGARFLAMAHVAIERDLTITTGNTSATPNPQPDVLYDGQDPDTQSVWWKVSGLGEKLWIGFAHASVETDDVKDGGGSTTAPSVSLKIYTAAGASIDSVIIPARRLYKLSNYARGLTNYRNAGEQLALWGEWGYAHLNWQSELLDVSGHQGDEIYLEAIGYGVRFYSIDVVEAFLGTAG